ncbi:hypothetical protein ABZP36_030856 [Zizania latifolia]
MASTPTTRKSTSSNKLQGKRPPRLLISSNSRALSTTHCNGKPSPSAKVIDEDSTIFGECLAFCKKNLFAEEGEEEDELVEVPEELILSRINSKKAIKSYQLGKQLSFQWSTGAGPRIGCVRDYPLELQFQALEEVSLSPRGGRSMRFSSPRPIPLTPNSIPVGRIRCSPIAHSDMGLKTRQRSATWTAF